MLNPVYLGLVCFFLASQHASAIKERIVFDPQIHKETPGEDSDYAAAVPEVGAAFLKQQQPSRVQDVNGALNFLTDFARFKAKQEEEEEEDQEEVAPRAEPDDQEEEAEDNDDGQQPPDVAESYFQQLIGRLDEKPKLETTTRRVIETTTSKILRTKAPLMAALQQQQAQNPQQLNPKTGGVDFTMIALMTCLAVAAAFGVIVSIFCFVKIQKRSRSSQRFDYSGPGSGVASSKKSGAGSHDSLNASAASAAASKLSSIFGGHGADKASVDKKLANNATLYHFEHHKKEMMAAESADVPNEFGDSEAESGDENDDNDYTVYECPGLAPTGEMQVDNPLFRIKQQQSQPSGGPARVSPPVVVHGLQGSPK